MFFFLLQTFPFTHLFFTYSYSSLFYTQYSVREAVTIYWLWSTLYHILSLTHPYIYIHIHHYLPISKHTVSSVIYDHCHDKFTQPIYVYYVQTYSDLRYQLSSWYEHCHDKFTHVIYIWSLMTCISHHSYYPIVDSTWVCLQVIQSRFILQSSSCIIYIHHVTFWCTGGCCNKSYSTPPITWWIHILTQYTM